MEKQAVQAFSMSGIPFSSHLPFHIILCEAVSQADYFKNFCLRVSALRLQSFPVHQATSV